MRLYSFRLNGRSGARAARRGAIWPLLVAILGLMLAGVALAVDASLLWQARQELHVAADASSLAAIQQLADDRLLLKRPGVMLEVVDEARHLAAAYGLRHHVLSRPLVLEIDLPHSPDVVLGFYDGVSQRVQPATPDDWDSPYLTAVEVTARRTRERGNAPGLFFARLFKLRGADVAASSTAILDRQVVGFRPSGNIHAPLMPIALLSDPAGLEEQSWEAQIDKPLSAGGGQDQYAFDKSSKRWSQLGDGITTADGLPEFVLKLPLGGGGEDSNGQLIHLGPTDLRTWLRQVGQGVHATDLAACDGQLTLGWDGLCPVPEGTVPAGKALEELMEKLRVLQSTGEPRAWPLYVPRAEAAGGQQPTVMLRGFVAARIADVQQSEGEEPSLLLVLQPTIMVTGTAATQSAAEINPYLAKARLLR